MRTFITLITAAAFMLHFALGCCAHHAHAAEGSVCSAHASAANPEHDCHDHHGHGESDHDSQQPGEQPAGDSEFPDHPCSDVHCAFMAAGSTVIAKDTYLAVLPLFVAEPVSHVSISPPIAATLDSGGQIALPVRTHLFNQVLLN
ncbi:MAG: hypothetical protein WD872_19885 [Pirellulaceae bacterium]